MSYFPCRSNAGPEGAMSQMQAVPPEGAAATALVATVIEFRPNIFMKTVETGWLTIASTYPVFPAFGPFTGGVLIVTEAPFAPSV